MQETVDCMVLFPGKVQKTSVCRDRAGDENGIHMAMRDGTGVTKMFYSRLMVVAVQAVNLLKITELNNVNG